MYDYLPRSLLIHDHAATYSSSPTKHGWKHPTPNPILVTVKVGFDHVRTFAGRLRGTAASTSNDTETVTAVTVITLDDVIRDIANKNADWVLAA